MPCILKVGLWQWGPEQDLKDWQTYNDVKKLSIVEDICNYLGFLHRDPLLMLMLITSSKLAWFSAIQLSADLKFKPADLNCNPDDGSPSWYACLSAAQLILSEVDAWQGGREGGWPLASCLRRRQRPTTEPLPPSFLLLKARPHQLH